MNIVDGLQWLWQFFLDHFWTIVAVVIAVRYGRLLYRHFIYTPLAGPDNKISLDEVAKGVVIVVFVWAAQRDGYRTHQWTYFSEGFYAALLAGLFAIAAIKPVVSVLKANKLKKQEDENKDSDDNCRDSGSDESDTPVRLPRQ